LKKSVSWIIQSVRDLIELYQADVEAIANKLDDVLVAEEVEEHNVMAKAWIEKGIEPKLANYVARLSSRLITKRQTITGKYWHVQHSEKIWIGNNVN